MMKRLSEINVEAAAEIIADGLTDLELKIYEFLIDLGKDTNAIYWPDCNI